jgi:hypothetical protein
VGEGGGHILKEVKELGALEDMLGLEGLLEVEVDSVDLQMTLHPRHCRRGHHVLVVSVLQYLHSAMSFFFFCCCCCHPTHQRNHHNQ